MTPPPHNPFILPDESGDPTGLLTTIKEVLERAVGELPLAVVALDREGLVRLWSPGAQRMFLWTAEEVLGHPLPTVPTLGRAQAQDVRQQALEQELHGVRLERVRKDGTLLEVRLWTTRLCAPDGRTVAMLGVMADDSLQKSREEALEQRTRQLRVMQEIAVTANESIALEPALRRVLNLLCDYTGWPLGHAYLVEPAVRQLRPTAIWFAAQGDRFEPFRRETEVRPLSFDEGLPGAVYSTGRPQWIADLGAVSSFRRLVAAQSCGLRAAFALPLLVKQEVVAVLEFFNDRETASEPALLELLDYIGAQVGRIVERQRAERERAELIERARQAVEDAAALRRREALRPLSAREQEVLELVAQGDDNLKIAATLEISERTVKAHLTSVLRKLSLENRTQAARFAWGMGMGQT